MVYERADERGLVMVLCEQPCPECGNEDFALTIESSRELGFSRIKCTDCLWELTDECCEEDLLDKFAKQFTQK